MATYQFTLPTPGTSADIRLQVTLTEIARTVADISANQVRCTAVSRLYKQTATGTPYYLSASSHRLVVNGVTLVNSTIPRYDFRSPNNAAGSVVALASATATIPMGPNGTKTVAVSATFTDGGAVIGSGTASGNQTLSRNYRVLDVTLGGVLRKAYVWYKDAGVWKRTLPWGKNAGTWKNPK